MKETRDSAVLVARVLREHLDTTTTVAEVLAWGNLCHSMADVFISQAHDASDYKVLKQMFLNMCGFAEAGFEMVS